MSRPKAVSEIDPTMTDNESTMVSPREQLEELYRLHSPELFGFLIKLCGQRSLAEDLLQETFLRAFRGLGQASGSGDELRSWLYAIARNVGIDHRRKESKIRRLERQVAAATEEGAEEDPPSESAERQALVSEALADLPVDERSLLLWFTSDFSFRKISAFLACSAPTAKRRVGSAIEAFSKALSRRRIREGGDL